MNLRNYNLTTPVKTKKAPDPSKDRSKSQFVFTGTPAEQAKKRAEMDKRASKGGYSGEAPANEGYDFLKAF